LLRYNTASCGAFASASVCSAVNAPITTGAIVTFWSSLRRDRDLLFIHVPSPRIYTTIMSVSRPTAEAHPHRHMPEPSVERLVVQLLASSKRMLRPAIRAVF